MINKAQMNTGARPVVLLVIICLVFSGLLAFTNQATTAQREEQQRQAELKSRMKLFSEAKSFDKNDVSAYTASGVISAETARAGDGKALGLLVRCESKGYGGLVPIFIAFDETGKITGLDFPSNQETPGLGQKVSNKNFYGQFLGNEASSKFVIGSKKSGGEKADAASSASTESSDANSSASQGTEKLSTDTTPTKDVPADAISGATVSSKAVVSSINTACKVYRQIWKEIASK